jgi:hypothetical protein
MSILHGQSEKHKLKIGATADIAVANKKRRELKEINSRPAKLVQ